MTHNFLLSLSGAISWDISCFSSLACHLVADRCGPPPLHYHPAFTDSSASPDFWSQSHLLPPAPWSGLDGWIYLTAATHGRNLSISIKEFWQDSVLTFIISYNTHNLPWVSWLLLHHETSRCQTFRFVKQRCAYLKYKFRWGSVVVLHTDFS